MEPVTVLLCLVVAVADGDTLTVRCGMPGNFETLKVRLNAIDAPELGQAHGREARRALSRFCFETVAEVRPRSTDRYGRTVADVQCRGADAGSELIRAGHAWVFDRYSKGYGHLYPLQSEARAAFRGLWVDPKPVPPWEWRRPSR